MTGGIKMKKQQRVLFMLGWVLLLMMTVFALGACSDEPNDNTPDDGTTADKLGFIFSYQGTDIVLGSDATGLTDKLGAYQSEFEAESCAFVGGVDRTYTYDSFVLNTSSPDEVYYVTSVLLTNDLVATQEGVAIGASLAEVTAAYGEEYEQSVNAYKYTKDQTTLTFIIENDSVISIEYAAIIE